MDKKIIFVLIVCLLIGFMFISGVRIQEKNIYKKYCEDNGHDYIEEFKSCISKTKECDAWDYFEGVCELDE